MTETRDANPSTAGASIERGETGPDAAVAAVIGFDARLAITDFSPGAERLFGLARAQAVGRDLAEALFPGELQWRVLDDVVQRLATSESCAARRVELVATCADGRRLPVELNAACLTLAPPRRFVALVRELDGRRQLLEELRDQAGCLERLARAQQALAATSASGDELLAMAPALAQRALDADAAAVELIDGDDVVCHAVSGALDDYLGARVPLAESLSGLALRENRALRSNACPADTRVHAAVCGPPGAHSMVVAPLHVNAQPLGTVRIVSREPDRFGETDVLALGMFATSLGGVLQRKRDSEAVHRSEEQYRMLFRDNPQPMWVFDLETLRFLAVNDAAVAQYGYSEAEFLRMTIRDIRDRSEWPKMQAALQHLPCDPGNISRWRHRRRDGEVFDVEISSDAIEFDGRAARLVMAHDVTARTRAEEGQASAVRALRLLGAANAAMIRIDDEARLLDEICRIVIDIGGYSLAGVGYCEHDEERTLKPMAAAGDHPEVVYAMKLSWDAESPRGNGPAGRAVRTGEAIVYADLEDEAQEFPFREAALQLGYRAVVTLPLRGESGPIGFLGMYSRQAHPVGPDELRLLQDMVDNIAFGIGAIRARRDRRRIQAELEYNASHDAVTGLDRYAVLEPLIARMARDEARVTAVMLVDLDRFNGINESMGHAHADLVLRAVAGRLLALGGDGVRVAHLVGDEFVVAMQGDDEAAALRLAEQVRAAIAEPIEDAGFRLTITATVGVAHAPAHGVEPIDLLRRAQAAKERGKAMGRDVVCAFLTEQMQAIEDRMTLGGALRGAARAGELQLHYQPQFAAATRALTGFEALLRWTNPTLGFVSPGRFIPIAESLGLMPEIGEWVLHAACRQARAWLDAGRSGFQVAVNVSAQQLQRPGLVASVAEALAQYGLPAHVLDIELTESSLMENVARVQGTLAELKALGVMLSLDDFGTGYSSLAYLKHFSLDKLKIDQSFVRGLPDNADDAAIARTIVSIGHQLRLVVAAEGVETQEQADFLQSIGCDELQGYFLGRPVAVEHAEKHFP